MNDREQKRNALVLSVTNRWFPQLEVDVEPARAIKRKAPVVTDLDVLSSIPDPFRGYRHVVFDCKTKARESAVNRALWLRGVLDRVKAEQGYCILKKDAIEMDHRIMSAKMGVVLLSEDEFNLYCVATTQNRKVATHSKSSDIDLWERMFALPNRYPALENATRYVRSQYWMNEDPAESCRKTIASLRSMHPEFDPSKPEHTALLLDYCALFARSLAMLVCDIFKAYLQPANQGELSEALLIMMYGGHEAYHHRNDLYKLVQSTPAAGAVADLSLPEWDRFLHLFRQFLDAPMEIQSAPLLLREVGFSILSGDTIMTFARELCKESPQGARFAVLIVSYLCRSAKLPTDFAKSIDNVMLPLLSIK